MMTKITTSILIELLLTTLYNQDQWIKVHAAEFLLWEGYQQKSVWKTFIDEDSKNGKIPQYRIGIWRVLYQASADSLTRKHYLKKIMRAYHEGPDKLHALETLAKLKVSLEGDSTGFMDKVLSSQVVNSEYIYGLWNLYYSDAIKKKDVILERLVKILLDPEQQVLSKILVCYVLRSLYLPNSFVQQLHELDYRPWEPSVQLQFLSSLFFHPLPHQVSAQMLSAKLFSWESLPDYYPTAMLALARRARSSDRQVIEEYYRILSNPQGQNYNVDHHATAIYSLLSYLKKIE